jgi:hypothetical protein
MGPGVARPPLPPHPGRVTDFALVPFAPAPPTAVERRRLRALLAARQAGLCAVCRKRPWRGILELSQREDRTMVICRSCGRKADAPTRIPKALATRRLPPEQRPERRARAVPADLVRLSMSKGTWAGIPRRDERSYAAWRATEGALGPAHEGCGGQLTCELERRGKLRCSTCGQSVHPRAVVDLNPPLQKGDPPGPFEVVTVEELLRWADAARRRACAPGTVLLNFAGSKVDLSEK